MMEVERLSDTGSEQQRELIRAGRRVRPSGATKRRALLALGLATASAFVPTVAAGVLKSFKAGVAAAWPLVATKWSAVVLIAALGAGVAVQRSRNQVESRPPAPRRVVELRAPQASDRGGSPASSAAEPFAALPVASAKPNAAGSAPKVQSLQRLSEVELFDNARSRLAAGDASGALQSLREQTQAYPDGNLVLEAQALRIEALEAVGQHQRAVGEAQAFLVHNPNGLISHRVRRWLESHTSP